MKKSDRILYSVKRLKIAEHCRVCTTWISLTLAILTWGCEPLPQANPRSTKQNAFTPITYVRSNGHLYAFTGKGELHLEDRRPLWNSPEWPNLGNRFTPPEIALWINAYGRLKALSKSGIRELEAFPPDSAKVSGRSAAWINRSREVRMFDGKTVQTIFREPVDEFRISNHLLYIDAEGGRHYIHDGKKLISLNQFFIEKVWVGDHVLAFLTDRRQLGVFYNGVSRLLEVGEASNVKLNGDILVWTNRKGEFNVFCKGRQAMLESFLPKRYSLANTSIVYENATGTIQTWEGSGFNTGLPSPRSFIAGEGFFAFTAAGGGFKIFRQGTFRTIDPREPRRYETGSNAVVFIDASGQFRWSSGGPSKLLETRQPQWFTVRGNWLVYLSDEGWLKMVNLDDGAGTMVQ